MLYKIFGALIIIAAGAIAFLTFQEQDGILHKKNSKKEAACVQLTPAQQLAKMINDDFQSLQESGQLPAQWSSIATVEVRMASELAKAILGKQRPNIQRVKEGKAFLELQFMDLPDEENPGVIIQASLFDIKSKNKIFEIGRTYTMNELNKVPPQEAPNKKEIAAQKNQQQAQQQQQRQQAPTPAATAPAANGQQQTPPQQAAPPSQSGNPPAQKDPGTK